MIYGLILSAGLSGRLEKFKPLAEYKGKTFIHNILLKLNLVCENIIIVTGNKANEVKENVKHLNINSKIEFVFNPEYEKGMFTSLQAGLRKADNSDWILYHFVDQPGLPEVFYKKFVEQIDKKHNWIQPKIKEQKGHPILIKRNIFQIILNAPLNSNLRTISNDPKVNKKFWECGYTEIFQDVDTEEDYSKLN
ncbi:MAG: NTP transferase domain-containing protein [Bacteroidetes bacterium]|nr:NTP transferase domain-containing protein [Bacteroidota bacterium]